MDDEFFANTKRHMYLDCEANSLYPSKIWCIVCVDIDTEERFQFHSETPLGGHDSFRQAFLDFAMTVDVWYGHNIIGYDALHINRILGEVCIPWQKCVDTLVLSRLFRPTTPFKEVPKSYNRQWGHSLDAWGRYLKYPKSPWADWTKFSTPMLEYCSRDCDVGIRIVRELQREGEGFSQQAIDLEHCVAHMLATQTDNGFYLNQVKATKLFNDTGQLLEEMNGKLRTLFPPTYKLIRNYIPKTNKDGTLGKVSERIIDTYTNNINCKIEKLEDDSYNLFVKEVFNPNSGQQVAFRLQELGWTPTFFTEKGAIKTDKGTMLDALEKLLILYPAKTELQCLAEYGIVDDRHTTSGKWLEMCLEGEHKDGRVHGGINPIGAATHRCAHFQPNMANIPRVVTRKVVEIVNPSLHKFDVLDTGGIYLSPTEVALTGLKGAYGWDARDCWSVPSDKYVLVGADAAGIQLRALAHYMDDKKYTKALLEGDIHEVNRQAAGISTRAKAKTFIYAWLLGAGDDKIGSIVGVEEDEYEGLFKFARDRKHWDQTLLQYLMEKLRKNGMKATAKNTATAIKGLRTKEQFLNKTPSLKIFRKDIIPAMAKRGYVTGLDGRKIWVPNEHLTMGAYLQGFEAVVIKQAMRLWHEDLQKQNVPFKLVATVHDEYQVECLKEHGEIVGEAIISSIKNAGKLFNTNCPLDGEFKIGRSWSETH
jgi:DNA polymerase-1